MRRNPVLAAFLLVLSAAAVAAEDNAVRRHPAGQTEASVRRIIVKFRATASSSRVQAKAAPDAVGALARRNALSVETSRVLVDGLNVMFVEPTDLSESADTTLAHLRADPDVEYAELDRRRYPHAAPNDPLFTQQWYLQNAQPSAIDASDAWDITTGNSNVVVAVLDTGVRFDHPDLQRAAQAGKLLPGYDFVSGESGGTFRTANDGNGRDADASDPGDWINSTDKQNSTFADCDITVSSWHGTRVSGLVGAQTNNAQGIAGVAWSPMILPVRVLGKCGGFDSDIIAAMHWAAGEHVNGVADNPTPAKIINLSLGAVGACGSPYLNAVSQLRALGVLVVASAGNEDGHAVDSPANCPGVLGVAGLRHAGTKVGFSNLGPEIGISAPAGNCNNNGCEFPIDTTTDIGTTTPAGPGYTNHNNLGTSFSAPLVAASAALMLSVNSRLEPAQLIARLQQSATPFPAPDGVSLCVAPTDVDQGECVCTTATCGAGMLNTAAAVAVASKPFVIVSASPTSPTAGQAVNLNGSASFAGSDRTIASYAWTVVSSDGVIPTLTNADQANATFTAPSAGAITLRLAVTDSAGEQDSADISVTTPAPPPPTPAASSATSSGGGGGGVFDLSCLLMGLLTLAGIRRRT